MISQLQAFLMEESSKPKEREVIVSERLKDHPFKIRSITLSEYDELRKQSVSHDGDSDTVDGSTLARNMVIAACIEPDFKDAEWLSSSGCVTPSQQLDKMLDAGEILNLSGEIMKASGFNNDLSKLKKKAKN